MKTPRTQAEFDTIDEAQKILKQEENWLSREKLAKKIDKDGDTDIAEGSAKARLSTFREYMEENGFETKEDAENPGNPKVKWKVEE